MAISDPPFGVAAADGGPDDLPRTLRREREARERQAREREMRERALGEVRQPSASHHEFPVAAPAGTAGISVSRLDIPFLHLMRFFLKAVFAAVPALIVLGIMVWTAGHVLQLLFPQLVKMQILILFPPN